jgi:hypothetical protein
VGETCGTHGRGEETVQGFGGKARRKETTWKTQDVDGRIESEWILGRLAGECRVDPVGSGWGRRRAVVSTVMNFLVLAPRSLVS